MKRRLALTLFLVVATQVLHIHAGENVTTASQAKPQQVDGDGYVEEEPYDSGPYLGRYQDKHYDAASEPYLDCPKPQPADGVKAVYLGHGSFVWREVAAKAAAELRGQRKAAPSNKPALERGTPQRSLLNAPTAGASDSPSKSASPAPEPNKQGPAGTAEPNKAQPAPKPAAATVPEGRVPSKTIKVAPQDGKVLSKEFRDAVSEAPKPKGLDKDAKQEAKDSTTAPDSSSSATDRLDASSPGKEAQKPVPGEAKGEPAAGSPQGTVPATALSGVVGDEAKPAAVISGAFLAPTSLESSEVGFLGTYDRNHVPPGEALAVGHHPTDDDLLFILHAINAQAEIFPVEKKDGKLCDNVTPTKVPLSTLAEFVEWTDPTIDLTNLNVARVNAFFDEDKQRYVLAWSTYARGNTTVAPPLFIAVSSTKNPLGSWMIWALDLRPDLMQGLTFCGDEFLSSFYLSNLHVSYSKESILIGASPTCMYTFDEHTQHLSALYVIAKESLYTVSSADEPDRLPETEMSVRAAIYYANMAWYRSVAETELTLVEDEFEPFNSHIVPVRPQGEEDCHGPPTFVMKVSQSHVSVATLTGEVSKDVESVEDAPFIKAVVVGKGADFTNSIVNMTDGDGLMPQPGTNNTLELVGVGMPKDHGGITYWATKHKEHVYLVTGEFWGTGMVRIPSIYWAILKTPDDLCYLTRVNQGMVASQEQLALGYPIIVGKNQGAVIAFSYSGAGKISNGNFPAYPGVAIAKVGSGLGGEGGIDLVHRGPGSLIINDPDIVDVNGVTPWGRNSAAHVCGDEMWFAVPVPAVGLTNDANSTLWYGSWLSNYKLS